MTELALFASWLAWGRRTCRKRRELTFTLDIDCVALERALFCRSDR